MDYYGLIAIASAVGIAIGGALEWLRRVWFDYKTKQRDLQTKGSNADFELRKSEYTLFQQPSDKWIAQLQEEVKILRSDISSIQTKSLEKIFEAVNKEAECQKRLAVQEQITKTQNQVIEDLKSRVSFLEKK